MCGPLDLGIIHAPGQGFSTDLSKIIGYDDINPLVNDDLKNYCFHGERKKEIIFESVNQPNYTSVWGFSWTQVSEVAFHIKDKFEWDEKIMQMDSCILFELPFNQRMRKSFIKVEQFLWHTMNNQFKMSAAI